MVRGEEFVLRRQTWMRSLTKETVAPTSGLSLTSPSKSPRLSVLEVFTIDPTPVLKRRLVAFVLQGRGAIFKWWLMMIIMWLFIGSITANRYVASGDSDSAVVANGDEGVPVAKRVGVRCQMHAHLHFFFRPSGRDAKQLAVGDEMKGGS